MQLIMELLSTVIAWGHGVAVFAAVDPVWSKLIEAAVSISSTASVILLAYLTYKTLVINKKVDAVAKQQTDDGKAIKEVKTDIGEVKVNTNGMQEKLGEALEAKAKFIGREEERASAEALKYRDESVGAAAVAAAGTTAPVLKVTEETNVKIDDQSHVLEKQSDVLANQTETLGEIEKHTEATAKHTKPPPKPKQRSSTRK